MKNSIEKVLEVRALTVILSCILSLNSLIAFADEEDSEIQGVEAELSKNIPSQPEVEMPELPQVLKKSQDTLSLDPDRQAEQKQVVVIQKNYMPKTGRGLLSAGAVLFPSDVFFKTYGGQLQASYFFNENWGVETKGILFSSAKSKELSDLESKQGVTASNLATLKSYAGAQVYFSSMYGKYAFNNRDIVPFEVYQTLGVGTVTTDKGSNPAVSLGLGQLVSRNRDRAWRFDLSVLFYQTETVQGTKQQQTSLIISIDYSILIPSVGKRW